MPSCDDKVLPTVQCRLLLLLAASAFNLSLATSAHATDYYMSPDGNDSNDGKSIDKAWKSVHRLSQVQSILRPGDTVWFKGGDYMINDSSPPTNTYPFRYVLDANGTASAPITYKKYQNDTPVLVFDKRTLPMSGFDSGGCCSILSMSGDYTVFDGINFKQTEDSRRVATVNTDKYISRSPGTRAATIYARHVTVKNCSVDNFSFVSINIPGSNALIEHCSFTNGGNHYFYLQGPGSTFRYNYMDGSKQINGGATIQVQYSGTSNNMVYGNFMINGSAYGIVFSGRVSGNEVFNNIIVNGGSGRTSGTAVGFWCEDGPMGSGNKFYNNTVIGKSMGGVLGSFDPEPGSRCGSTPPMQPVEIYNNIFYPSQPVRALAGDASYPKLHDNIFYNVSGSVPPGNISVNPMLANPNGNTSADAVLTAGSPAIDKAIAPFPINDYQGGKRPYPNPGKADIGAFEFGAPPGQEAGPLGGGSFPPSAPVFYGPNGEVCPSGYLPLTTTR